MKEVKNMKNLTLLFAGISYVAFTTAIVFALRIINNKAKRLDEIVNILKGGNN